MSMSRRTFISSSTAAATATAIAARHAGAQGATPSSATPMADAVERENRVLAAMEEHGIPGAIVLYDSPETGRWTAALGVADLEGGEPMTTDMHMRIGSITKTFTATMILQLVDQGALALDDTLASLLPSQSGLPNADAITLRHLLTMQSGIPDYINMEGVLTADPYETVPPEDLVALVADQAAEFAPGEGNRYSNTNYILLGMIAEEVTGTPWPELVQANILDEVGLAHTTIPDGPELPSPSPKGYDYGMMQMVTGEPGATPAPDAEPVDATLINTSVLGPAGNMIGTIADLHAWMRVLLDGSLLSPELQADRMDLSDEGFIESPIGGMTYGLGIAMKDGGIGHDGGITGFRSTMHFWPDTEETVITMTNVVPTADGQDPAPILIGAVLGD
jgi:D-alanyl-D-alanine carboxypeptidase